MMIKYYDITENELNSKAFEAGSVYFCYDTLRIYYDSISDNKRIDISEFAVVLDTENERDGLLSPIPNKLYYIKENNKLYIYLNSEWFAINEPTTLAQLGITATATEINHLSGVSSNVQDQIDIKAPKKLVCTVTDSSGTYTCDHTFAEIVECHNNGGVVTLVTNLGEASPDDSEFDLIDLSDTEAVFKYSSFHLRYGGSSYCLRYCKFTISSDNSITFNNLRTIRPLTSPVYVSDGGTGYTSIVDTTYTTARYRASALVSSETTPTQNGVINWVYE